VSLGRVLNLVVTASAAVLVAVIAATGIASALSSTEGDARPAPAPAGPPKSTYTVTRMGGDSQERGQEFVATVSDSGRRLVVHADP